MGVLGPSVMNIVQNEKKESSGSAGTYGVCSSGFNCSGGGGQCGAGFNCGGGGGRCGAAFNCSGQ